MEEKIEKHSSYKFRKSFLFSAHFSSFAIKFFFYLIAKKLALILVLTALAAFIYAFILYKSENEYLYNIITILLGALFFFLIGSSTRVITNQKYLLFSLLFFIILSLIIFIIKTLTSKTTAILISYKQLINLFSTISGSLLFKKRKV